jgi:hypothetical protein
VGLCREIPSPCNSGTGADYPSLVLSLTKQFTYIILVPAVQILEWRQATITYADPATMTYSIAYTYGETATNLESDCIRAFRPFVIGDEVELRESDQRGTILSMWGTICLVRLTDEDILVEGPPFVHAPVVGLQRYTDDE